MKIKPDWLTNLHAIRKREIDIIFSGCREKVFEKMLELGSGDCYQTGLLTKYAIVLTATEYSSCWLSGKKDTENTRFKVCDAEHVGQCFGNKEFDFVFSSNVIEHLTNIQPALSEMREVMKDDGFAVHVMPAPLWKAFHLLFFYPNLILNIIEKVTRHNSTSRPPSHPVQKTYEPDNNPKLPKNKYKIFRPVPHGAYRSNFEEFFKFARTRWLREFSKAGFEPIAVLKGPVSSPFGFGLNYLRLWLERIGFATEYIYVLKKKGFNAHLEKLGLGISGSDVCK